MISLPGKTPVIDNSGFIANSANLIGAVTLGQYCSVWFHAVIRADNDTICIGNECNIQDGAVLHTDPGLPMRLGNRVTVGHQAVLHGCQIADGSLIGIHSTLLNGSRIGHHCLVGAGAVVTENKVFEDHSLILGAPARRVRSLTDREIEQLELAALEYVKKIPAYRQANS